MISAIADQNVSNKQTAATLLANVRANLAPHFGFAQSYTNWAPSPTRVHVTKERWPVLAMCRKQAGAKSQYLDDPEEGQMLWDRIVSVFVSYHEKYESSCLPRIE